MAGYVEPRSGELDRASAVSAIRAPYLQPSHSRRRRVLAVALLIFVGASYGFWFALGTTYVLVQLAVPLALMAVLTIAMLPETGRALVKTQEALLFIFVVALLCWPDYIAIAIPGLPWITLIRLAAIPLALVFLLNLSQSAEFRRQLKAILGVAPSVVILIGAFCLISFISIAFSNNITASVNKFNVVLLNWILVFFVSCYVFSKPGRVVRLAYVIWFAAIFVCLLAVQEARHEVVPWSGHIPSFLRIDDETLKQILTSKARAATGQYRVQSKFTTPLGFAEFLSFATPFVLHMVMTTRSNLVRGGAVLTLPLIVYTVVKTDARLGMVGIFITILLYALAWGALRWRQKQWTLFGPAIVLSYPFVFISFIFATFYVGHLRALVWGTGAQQASSDSRQEQIAQGLPLILKQPWGYGIGQAAEILNYRQEDDFLTIDSYYLSIALDIGIAGFLIFYGIFLAIIAKGFRNVLRQNDPDTSFITPLLICIINFVIIKSVLSQSENHPLVFIFLGAMVAQMYLIRARQKAKIKRFSLAPAE